MSGLAGPCGDRWGDMSCTLQDGHSGMHVDERVFGSIAPKSEVAPITEAACQRLRAYVDQYEGMCWCGFDSEGFNDEGSTLDHIVHSLVDDWRGFLAAASDADHNPSEEADKGARAGGRGASGTRGHGDTARPADRSTRAQGDA